jgi:WD40 repeat protein
MRKRIVTMAVLCMWFGSVQAQDRPTIYPQLGHNMIVTSVAFSPNGKLLASGSADHTIKLWDVASGREIRTLSGHNEGVNSIALSLDGRTLASASDDKTIKLWDLASGTDLVSLGGHTDKVNSVAFSADGRVLASASDDRTIKLWDIASKRELRTLSGRSGAVWSVTFAPDGHLLASGNFDDTIQLWDVANGHPLRTLRGAYVAFSPDGRLLAAASAYSTGIDLWDVDTGRKLRSFSGQKDNPTSVAFSPDGRTLASGSQDKTVRIWDVASGLTVRTFSGHFERVSSVAFSPDGRILASGSDDQTIKLWDAASGREIRTLTGHSEAVYTVAFSPDGRILASGYETVKLWDAASGRVLHKLTGHAREINAVSFSPDGRTLASGSSDQTIKFWNVTSGQSRRTISGIPDPVLAVAFSPDGRVLASGIEDYSFEMTGVVNAETISLWDTSNGHKLRAFRGDTGDVASLAFSPDGRSLASGNTDKTVKLWDVASGHAFRTFSGQSGNITSVAFSPDGSILASGSEDKIIELWDVESGRGLRTLSGHLDYVHSVAFSPNGRVLASGSWDKTIKLWDVASGREIRTLSGHLGFVQSVVFAPDGRLLVSGARDGTTRIWDVASGSELASLFEGSQLRPLSNPNQWLVVDPSGRLDAGRLEDISEFSWVISDDPFRPLSPEIFMRDYYEPRLLPRLLACHDAETRGDADACSKAFKPVPPVAELNRIQPDVKIAGVHRGASAEEALVDVEVAGKEDDSQKNGKTTTAVYDLRLFRDGQIVGQWPEPLGGMGGAEDIGQWRIDSKVPTTDGRTKAVHRFTVHLARRDAGRPVRLTAYAFNEDRVKSETAADESYKVPSDITPAKPRAYVITIGVNAYQNPKWKLSYAAKDAQDISGALQRIQGYEMVPVPLVSVDDANSKLDQATKANILSVLALLAGTGQGDRQRLKNVVGVVIDKLQKVTPDDLVIIAFSGHGYTDLQSRFYLLPSDSGTESAVTDALLSKFISSDELSQWLRNVDAGEIVMLIDACHSAAGVPESFKPGPMGDRGLGQLAYDKGMQILAATQADDVALESEKLGQGLLTYALIQEGLKAHKAAPSANPITIKTWLHYAEKRVPELYDDIQTGKLKLVGKDPIIDPAFYSQAVRHAQTPALFDFYRQAQDPILLTQ